MKLKRIILPVIGLSAISSLTLTSCKKNNVEEKHASLQQIFVNPTEAITEYALGEEFNKDNLVVTAVRSDNSQEKIALDKCEVDAKLFNKNEIGEYKIYVNYIEGNIKASTSYTVNVDSIAFKQSKYLKGILVSGISDKIIAGKELDTSNFKAIAEYSDNTSADVTSKVSKDFGNFDNNKMGIYQLKFSYAEEYELNGKKETRTSETFVLVTVDGKPQSIKFVSGTLSVEQDTVGPDGTMNTIDVSDWLIEGYFLNANYEDLPAIEIDKSRIKLVDLNTGKAGKQEVTIEYYHPGQLKAIKTKVIIDVIAIPEPTFFFSADDLGKLGYNNNDKITGETQINQYISLGSDCQYKTETSSKEFGDLSFDSRFQTNGKGNSSKNYIKFTLTKDSTVGVIGRNQKGSENIAFYDAEGNACSNYLFFDSNNLTKNKVTLKAGTYYFYATQAVQIYGIQIWEL